MRLISPVLQRVIYPALGTVGFFHSHCPGSVRVVTYHGVLPEGYESTDAFVDDALVSAAAFRWQLRLLKKHYNVISPGRFRRWISKLDDLPERAVLLTCDDGLLNNATTMLPILEEEGLTCLFFVTGGSASASPGMLWYMELYVMIMQARGHHEPRDWQGNAVCVIPADAEGKRACWFELMKTLSRLGRQKRYDFLRDAARWWGLETEWRQRFLDDPLRRERFQLMGECELKRMTDAGMGIGAHTMSHPILSEQSSEEAHDEIDSCREVLRKSSGQDVWALAYPFGDPQSVGAREYNYAEAGGYDCAFVNVGGALDWKFSRFALPRIHVTGAMSLPVYEAHVSGFHGSLQKRMRAG